MKYVTGRNGEELVDVYAYRLYNNKNKMVLASVNGELILWSETDGPPADKTILSKDLWHVVQLTSTQYATLVLAEFDYTKFYEKFLSVKEVWREEYVIKQATRMWTKKIPE